MDSRELPPVNFLDPVRGARNLLAVHESFIRSGSSFPLDDFTAHLTAQLHVSPDPDLALTNLLRFSEASVSKASLFNDLIHYPVVMASTWAGGCTDTRQGPLGESASYQTPWSQT